MQHPIKLKLMTNQKRTHNTDHVLKFRQRPLYVLLFLYSLFALFAAPMAQGELFDPLSIYLTWDDDPSTTMTIRWITKSDRPEDTILYRQGGYMEWQTVQGSHLPMPDNHPYFIHRVELTDLSPDTDYFFKPGKEGVCFKFRTMPNVLNQPIRFAVGGDMYHGELETYITMNKTVAATDPMFAILGGDISYAAPKFGLFSENFSYWLDWLKVWKETMITPDGRLIPMLTAIGNHEVIGRYNQSPDKAKFFYALFKTPKLDGYGAFDFGNYLSIFILDTDHTHPIEGKQKQWLASAMKQRKDALHKFAVYHVPAYPSVRKDGVINQKIRKEWIPIFETFGLNAAFEHHDHAYKRTHPIYQGKVNQGKGILFFGDGAWGVKKPRTPKSPKELWYIAKSKASHNFILVILYGEERHYMALDLTGKQIDYTTN